MLSPTDHALHRARIEADGFTILEDAIEPALVDALAADLARLTRDLRIEPAGNVFEGARTRRVYNLLARGPLYQAVPVHPNVLPLIESVLDRGCLVSSISSIRIEPGETAQPLHADDQHIPLPRPHVPIVCNTMWALTDFTAENGATRVCRGSHAEPGFPDPFGHPAGLVPAVMRRGSVLVFNGSVWHGGGANHTGEARLGLAMNYCAGWVRQQENQQLGIPLDVARTFSPELRKLAGFHLYKKLMGHIARCSPLDLLDGSTPRPVVGT
jgi:ectoine hydroxylase-related dioxygenase (phytanoyl-CoA dioxygenase family)